MDHNDFNELFEVTAAGTTYSDPYVVDPNKMALFFEADVQAISGTSPTLDITVQISRDKETWVDLKSLSQLTSTTSDSDRAARPLRYARFKVVAGGTTPTATIDLFMQAIDGDYADQITHGAGEDISQDVLKVEQRSDSNYTITTDTGVSSTSGVLRGIVLMQTDAAPTAGSIDVYDNTAGSGNKLFTVTIDTTVFRAMYIPLNLPYSNGIYVDFTTTTDVAVVLDYRDDS